MLDAAGHGTFQEDNLHMEVKLRSEDVPEDYDTIAKVADDSLEPKMKITTCSLSGSLVK